MELGLMSFGDRRLLGETGGRVSTAQVLREQLERITLAEDVGIGWYGLGEHHLDQYAISNPGTVLAAAAAQTERITLSTAVTVLSTEDPVRLFSRSPRSTSSAAAAPRSSPAAAPSRRASRCSAPASATTTSCTPRSSTS